MPRRTVHPALLWVLSVLILTGSTLGAAGTKPKTKPGLQKKAAAKPAPKAPAPKGELTLAPGEVRLDGTILSADAEQGMLLFEATAVTRPGAKREELSEAQKRLVQVSAKTTLHVRGSAAQKLTLPQVGAGTYAVVLGKEDAGGQSVAARTVAVWSSEKEGKYAFEPPTPTGMPSARTEPAPEPITLTLANLPAAPPPPADRPELVPHVGHAQGARFVSFLANPNELVSASDDGMWKVWDLKTSTLKKTHLCPEGPSAGWALSPDRNLLAYGSGKGLVVLCEPVSGIRHQAWQSGDSMNNLAFSPDGGLLVTGGYKGGLQVRDVQTGAEVRKLPGHRGSVNGIHFSPDGKTFASTGSDGAVRLWGVREQAADRVLVEGEPMLTRVCFSSDGALIATLGPARENTSAGTNLLLTVRETATGKVRNTLSLTGSPNSSGLTPTPGGKTILVSGHQAREYDWQTGKIAGTLPASGAFWGVAFSPDGKSLAAATLYNSIRVTGYPDGALRKSLGRDDASQAVDYSSDGRWIALGTGDGAVSIWNAHSGEMHRRLRPGSQAIAVVRFSPDSKELLIGSRSPEVRICDPLSGTVLRKFQHDVPVTDASYSADGRWIAVTGADRISGVGATTLWDVRTGARGISLKVPDSGLIALAFTRDGGRIVGAQVDGSVGLWDASTGEKASSLGRHSAIPRAVVVSPNGRLAVSCAMDSAARVYDLGTGATLYHLQNVDQVWTAAFTPDSRHLITFWPHGGIVWDLQAGRAVRTVGGTRVRSAAMAPGKPLAALATNRSVDLLDISTGRIQAHLVPIPAGDDRRADCSEWLSATPEGYYDCSEGADRVIQWRFGTRYVPFSAFEETHRNGSVLRRALAGTAVTEPPLTLTRVPPDCTVLDPKPESVVSGVTARLLVEAIDDRSVQGFRVFVNGVPVPDREVKVEQPDTKELPARKEDLEAGKVSTLVSLVVPLPPGEQELRVRVEARDDEKLRGDTVITLLRPDEEPVKGDLYLVSVGVSGYANRAYNLSWAAADAQALAAAFAGQQGTTYGRVLTTVLTDAQATGAAIRSALKTLSAVRPQDTVVLLFSGHGLEDQGQFYFAPHEIDLQKIGSTGVPWSEVVETLATIPGRKLLLADACHSGGKLKDTLGKRQLRSEDLARSTRRTGILMLASSRGDEVSLEKAELQHGVFTAALLEALAGKAAVAGADTVTLADVLRYVPERVAELTEEKQTPWVPQLDEFSLTAVLARVPPNPAGASGR